MSDIADYKRGGIATFKEVVDILTRVSISRGNQAKAHRGVEGLSAWLLLNFRGYTVYLCNYYTELADTEDVMPQCVNSKRWLHLRACNDWRQTQWGRIQYILPDSLQETLSIMRNHISLGDDGLYRETLKPLVVKQKA